MTDVHLVEDAERFVEDRDELKQPAVYALNLSKPLNVAERWDRHFENRPDYWDSLQAAKTVVYVGAAYCLEDRLEDHMDGDVRKTVLTRVCDIQGVRNVWFCDSMDEALQRESQKAIELRNWLRNEPVFVHWN